MTAEYNERICEPTWWKVKHYSKWFLAGVGAGTLTLALDLVPFSGDEPDPKPASAVEAVEPVYPEQVKAEQDLVLGFLYTMYSDKIYSTQHLDEAACIQAVAARNSLDYIPSTPVDCAP